MKFDPSHIRSEFPALSSEALFFDNPGGTQVHQNVIDEMSAYLTRYNANRGGAFTTSQQSDEVIHETRSLAATFLNASQASELIFGSNMTTLTFALSHALALEFQPGDEIIVTRLDHDANISPWLRVADDRNCHVHWLDFDVEDGTLQIERLEGMISDRTRLIAVGYASNALGTTNPVHRVVELAHGAGALCFVDAVQYAPHGPIDVQDLDCDFLAVSAYKFFGPHLGLLYGKQEHLERLRAYKVRPASANPPGKFETGTQNHEGIAGLRGALTYLASLGERFDAPDAETAISTQGMRRSIEAGMNVIQAYERGLSRALLEGLSVVPGLQLHGLTDVERLDERVPTVSFTMEGNSPQQIAKALGEAGIYVWDGNYYALAVTERLGLEDTGGMVRVGLTHYNTISEVDHFVTVMHELVAAG
jgi:cysteine desulfurase family protein (TIGR01976 family)